MGEGSVCRRGDVWFYAGEFWNDNSGPTFMAGRRDEVNETGDAQCAWGVERAVRNRNWVKKRKKTEDRRSRGRCRQ